MADACMMFSHGRLWTAWGLSKHGLNGWIQLTRWLHFSQYEVWLGWFFLQLVPTESYFLYIFVIKMYGSVVSHRILQIELYALYVLLWSNRRRCDLWLWAKLREKPWSTYHLSPKISCNSPGFCPICQEAPLTLEILRLSNRVQFHTDTWSQGGWYESEFWLLLTCESAV